MTALKWIEIEAFRGFAAKRRLNLDADFVLLAGGNGVGKSSVVDAVTWALTGAIAHLGKRKQRRTEEYVTSAYRSGESARVAVGLEISGRVATAVRVGDATRSSLRLEVDQRRWTGEAAEIELARHFGLPSPSELQSSLDRWGVLRQDEIRAILDADPDEIHGRLRELLGLSVLDDFEQFADEQHQARSKQSAELRKRVDTEQVELDALEGRLASLDERMSTSAEDSHATHRLRATIEDARDVLLVRLAVPTDLPTYRDVAAQLRVTYSSLQQIRQDLANTDTELAQLPQGDLSSADIERRRAERQRDEGALAARLAQAQADLRAAEATADRVTALAAAAIPLLTDACPVCGQGIQAAEVEARLNDLANAATAGAIAAARKAIDAVLQDQSALESRIRAEGREEKQALTIERHRRDLAATRRAAIEQLRSLSTGTVDISLLGENPTLDAIDRTQAAVTAVGRAIRSVVSAAEVGEIAIQRAEVAVSHSAALARLANSKQELDRTATLVREADAVRKAARIAGVEVTTSALRALNPHFGEVYRRLAPHPTFTDLGLRHDVYYNKGRTLPVLSDPVAQVEANPGIICSIGQLNVVALSYFLALALLGDDPLLPFVILDDPLQSLDDVNVLGFADLCRYIRQKRQVIVTTHDRRYADLLERKLAPRNDGEQSLTLEFEGWDRSGPSIQTRPVDAVAVPQLLQARGAA